MALISDRCDRSLAVLTSIKYESDLKDETKILSVINLWEFIFAQIENIFEYIMS